MCEGKAEQVRLKITGTLVWYYYICHREVWLMAHELEPDKGNPFLELGRLVQNESYSRERKELSAPGMKIDVLRARDGQLIVGEVKKSSRFMRSATMQLAYYLWRLRQMGVEAKGELLIPKERKRIPVQLTDEVAHELQTTFREIEQIVSQPVPPSPVRIPFCRNCAYREFCWV